MSDAPEVRPYIAIICRVMPQLYFTHQPKRDSPVLFFYEKLTCKINRIGLPKNTDHDETQKTGERKNKTAHRKNESKDIFHERTDCFSSFATKKAGMQLPQAASPLSVYKDTTKRKQMQIRIIHS